MYDPSSPFAGEYQPYTHTMHLARLELAVFLHELNHAVHGPWIIGNSVWEEGMARGAEVAEMNLLDAQGVPGTSSYFDLHHQYGYDQYYDESNTGDVGVYSGAIYGDGDPALVLLRYEQAGYAFGKALLDFPSTLRLFNAKLFKQPNGSLSDSALRSMFESVRPKVEGQPASTWFASRSSTPPHPLAAAFSNGRTNTPSTCSLGRQMALRRRSRVFR